MHKKLRIGIDVDGVVCPSPEHWLSYLEGVSGKVLPRSEYKYELYEPFQKELEEKGLGVLDWWKSKDLYDNVEGYDKIPAFKKAKEVINKWSSMGHEIVFISTIKGDHAKSKFEFLKRNFPVDGYIPTKEKNLVDVDIMIDDHYKNLDLFKCDKRRDNTALVFFPTSFNSNLFIDGNSIWEMNANTDPYLLYTEGGNYRNEIN